MIADLSPKVRRTGVRAFFRIAAKWHLTADQQVRLLGLLDPAALDALQAPNAEVSDSVTERVSLVLGIYVAQKIIFGTPDRQRRWLTSATAAEHFDGRTPLDVMTSGDVEQLYAVRYHLDAALD